MDLGFSSSSRKLTGPLCDQRPHRVILPAGLDRSRQGASLARWLPAPVSCPPILGPWGPGQRLPHYS